MHLNRENFKKHNLTSVADTSSVRFHSENATNVFRQQYAGDTPCRPHGAVYFPTLSRCVEDFTLRPNYAGEIWKRTENSPVSLDLCLTKTRAVRLRKVPPKKRFSECFPSTLKRKACTFKYLRYEERFGKARPNRRNKAGVYKNSNY